MSLATTPIDNPAVTGNWTDSRQYAWIYNAHSCGRIPADYNETYVCVGASQVPSSLTTYGAMDIFEPCCNKSLTNHDASLPYRGECQLIWCYTSDEQEALVWPSCINQRLKAYAAGMPGGNSSALMLPNSTYGKCEIIDYDRLKKGVNAARSLSVGLWRAVVGGLLVTAAMQLL